jgi:hypothetical protein
MAKNGLPLLLKSLQPRLSNGKYCIGTFDEAQLMGIANYLPHIFGIFRESEGITVVFADEAKPALEAYTDKKIEGPFALITLKVESPLSSVGLLAAVTAALAKEGIACNAFSAYHHDHLLVPHGKRDAALAALKKLEAQA